MVGEEHDRVALEELVRSAGSIEEGADRRVGLLERLVGGRAVRAGGVRGEVIAREVVGKEVEAVARDEPPPDRGCVRIDRAGAAAAYRERRSRPVRLEQAVEEEAARPVGGAAHSREGRQVAVAAAKARDVHGGCDVARILERLVDRDRVGREMARVHVEDRVEQRLREPGRAQGGERGAVLDEPALLPVPPDE